MGQCQQGGQAGLSAERNALRDPGHGQGFLVDRGRGCDSSVSEPAVPSWTSTAGPRSCVATCRATGTTATGSTLIQRAGDGTTAFSPPTIQIPRHQGRNVIPIKIASGATSVTVEFSPTPPAARARRKTCRRSLRTAIARTSQCMVLSLSSGQNTIQITNGVRNSIVNLVVAVTNPNGTGAGDDGSGKGFDAQETFNYKARIVSGGTIAPNTTRPW